jgi:HSP20 family protein
MTRAPFALPRECSLDARSSSTLQRSVTGHQAPAVNIGEADGAYHVTVDLPDLSQKTVNVDVQGRRISIRGAYPETNRADQSLVVERAQGTLAKTLQLPFPINVNVVMASFDTGVLNITLPKA